MAIRCLSNNSLLLDSTAGISFRQSSSVKAGVTVDGDFFVDTDTLYVDEGNDRVGVGTSAPSTTLDVAGTIKSNVYVIGSLPSASPAGQRAFVSNSTVGVGSTSVGVGVTSYAGGSNTIPVYSDGSSWRVG